MSNNYNSIQFDADDKSNSKLYPAQNGYQYNYPMSEFYQYQYPGYGGYQGASYAQYQDSLNMNINPSAPMPYLFSHLEPESAEFNKVTEPQRTASTSSSSSSSNQQNSDNLDMTENSEPQQAAGAKPPVIYAWMKKVHVNSSKG